MGFANLVGSAVDVRPGTRRGNNWDDTLADRVRIALALGFGDLASGIGIRANHGVITLRGEVDELTYVAQLWRCVQRDDYLMRTASGALHDRTWPELS